MRDLIKLAVHLFATVVMLPALLSFAVRARLLGRDRALHGSSQRLARLPGLTGIVLRRAFYAVVLPHCSRTATIEFGALLSHAGARIGHRVYVGPYATLGFVTLDDDVLVASGAQVLSGRHTHASDDPARPPREQAIQKREVRVGRGAWLGAGAIVMADVGAGTIVGAGAVVTAPLPGGMVAAGVPARVIRAR